MFTGLVSAIGHVARVDRRDGLVRWSVEAPYDAASIPLGASICHDGCCLTVVSVEEGAARSTRYEVEIAAETLSITTLGSIEAGARVNLERSLRLGDELGGHIVTGHVDGVGRVTHVTRDGAGWRIEIEAPPTLAALIAPKGSIAVDGVSLTVNSVDGDVFGVLIIPHTWEVTTLSRLTAGALVNLEVDPLARYVARLLDARGR